MLKDPKTEAFAGEFFGQWLRYRDYLSKDTIPATAFPGYDDHVAAGVFRRGTDAWLIAYLIPAGPETIDELLHSDATFVNATLARFYGGTIEMQYRRLSTERADNLKRRGLPTPTDPNADWYRVEGLRSAGRGGMFGMPVILTTNSAGQRTSPVKRGFWVVHRNARCTVSLLPTCYTGSDCARVAEDGKGKLEDDSRDVGPTHDESAMCDVPRPLRRPRPDTGRL